MRFDLINIRARLVVGSLTSIILFSSTQGSPVLTITKDGSIQVPVSSSGLQNVSLGLGTVTVNNNKSILLYLQNLGSSTLTFSGSPGWANLGGTSPSLFTSSAVRRSVTGVGSTHLCSIVAGTLRCWGFNNFHVSFGDSSSDFTVDPTRPPANSGTLTSIMQISAGEDSTCALLSSGALRCWGVWYSQDIFGGGPTPNFQTIPTIFVPDAGTSFPGFESGVGEVAVGFDHSCAIRLGAVWCWGSNEFGQLGDHFFNQTDNQTPTYGTQDISASSVNPYPLPVRPRDSSNVAVLTSGVQSIAAGRSHSCAVQSGAVYCWGDNSSGQLGLGTLSGSAEVQNTTSSITPQPSTILSSGVSQIVAGWSHNCAIKLGAVYCWGSNIDGSHSGQLGRTLSSGSYSSVPTLVPGLSSGVVSIVAGTGHTCALQNGTIKCWGSNETGQLGNGSALDSTTPVTAGTMTSGIETLSAGNKTTCATQNSKLYCWGQMPKATMSPPDYQNFSSPQLQSHQGSGDTNENLGVVAASDLSSGGILPFQITVHPLSAGDDLSATLSVPNDDSSYPHLTFVLGGAVPPQITTQPTAQIVAQGTSPILSVAATGTAPLTYQWQKNGSSISGATSSSLTLTSATVADTATYTCVVSNGGGTATSNPAGVNVIPNLPGSLAVTPSESGTSVDVSWSLYINSDGTTDTGTTYVVDYVIQENASTAADFSGAANSSISNATTLNIASLTTGARYCFRLNANGSETYTDMTHNHFTTGEVCLRLSNNSPVLSDLGISFPASAQPYLMQIAFKLGDREYQSTSEKIQVEGLEYKYDGVEWKAVDFTKFPGYDNLGAGSVAAPVDHNFSLNTLSEFAGQQTNFQIRLKVIDASSNSSGWLESTPTTIFPGMSTRANYARFNTGGCSLSPEGAPLTMAQQISILLTSLALLAVTWRLRKSQKLHANS